MEKVHFSKRKNTFFFERLSVNFAAAFDVNRMQARFFTLRQMLKIYIGKKFAASGDFHCQMHQKKLSKCYQKEFSEMLSEFV